MKKKDVEDRMVELKSDYARLQGDLEKLESLGRSIEPTEKLLKDIEGELKNLRKKLAEM